MLILLKLAVTVLFIVSIVLLVRSTIYVNRRFMIGHRISLAVEFFLEIRNESNFPGRFELFLEDPAQELEFIVGSKKNPIEAVERPVSVMNYNLIEEQRTVAAAASSGAGGKSKGSSNNKSAKKGGGVGAKAKAGLGIVPAIGGLISGVGAILPGRLGAPLRNMGNTMRRSTTKVTRVTKAPTRMVGKTKQLSTKTKGVQKKVSAAGVGEKKKEKKSGNRQENDAVIEYEQDLDAEGAVAGYEYEEEVYYQTWYTTPLIEPLSSNIISVSILPEYPFETHEYSFEIITQLVEQDRVTFPYSLLQPRLEVLDAMYPARASWRRIWAQGVTFAISSLSVVAGLLLTWQTFLFWKF